MSAASAATRVAAREEEALLRARRGGERAAGAMFCCDCSAFEKKSSYVSLPPRCLLRLGLCAYVCVTRVESRVCCRCSELVSVWRMRRRQSVVRDEPLSFRDARAAARRPDAQPSCFELRLLDAFFTCPSTSPSSKTHGSINHTAICISIFLCGAYPTSSMSSGTNASISRRALLSLNEGKGLGVLSSCSFKGSTWFW